MKFYFLRLATNIKWQPSYLLGPLEVSLIHMFYWFVCYSYCPILMSDRLKKTFPHRYLKIWRKNVEFFKNISKSCYYLFLDCQFRHRKNEREFTNLQLKNLRWLYDLGHLTITNMDNCPNSYNDCKFFFKSFCEFPPFFTTS